MASGTDQGDGLQGLSTCSICLETCKDPRYLPCRHKFCKSCIQKLVLSTVETEGGFPCPVCRRLAHEIAPTEGGEALADALPGNQFIRSKKLCNACEINKSNVKAVSWCIVCEEALCRECEKCHRSFKVSASHKIIPISDIQQNDDFKTSELVICKDHPSKKIELYCVDHSNACCTLCAILSHRKCGSVISIEEAAKEIKSGEDTTKLLERIDKTEKILDMVLQNRIQNLADIETDSDFKSSNISKMKRELIQHLNNIESETQTELVATRKQLSLHVTDEINKIQSQQSALEKWKTLLKGSDQQCLISLNDVKEKIENLNVEMIVAMPNVRHVSIQYNATPALAHFSDTMKSFGNIEVKENNIKVDTAAITILRTNFHSGEIRVLHTIYVGTKDQLSGIFFGSVVLLTVSYQKCVKKYSNDLNRLSKLQLENEPKDIDVIDNTRIVVSSYVREVYIIDGINMTLLKTLPLPNIPVHGVNYYGDNQVIVAGIKTLTWVNMTSGANNKSVVTSGESYFVSSTCNNDYIYGNGKNSVSCRVKSTDRFTYTNNELSGPRGVGIDCHGNMYIAGRDSNNIHQITNDGKLVRIIPAAAVGVTSPWTIRFKPKSNIFVVTCGESGKASICKIV